MDYKLLSAAPLFNGLSEDEIVKLLTDIPTRIRKFKPSTLLAQSNEIVNSLMIVLRGTVKGEMVDFAGKVITIPLRDVDGFSDQLDE